MIRSVIIVSCLARYANAGMFEYLKRMTEWVYPTRSEAHTLERIAFRDKCLSMIDPNVSDTAKLMLSANCEVWASKAADKKEAATLSSAAP